MLRESLQAKNVLERRKEPLNFDKSQASKQSACYSTSSHIDCVVQLCTAHYYSIVFIVLLSCAEPAASHVYIHRYAIMNRYSAVSTTTTVYTRYSCCYKQLTHESPLINQSSCTQSQYVLVDVVCTACHFASVLQPINTYLYDVTIHCSLYTLPAHMHTYTAPKLYTVLYCAFTVYHLCDAAI
jgi:hypothetical protein